MNTVLDDSKKLCLPNSEIIHLSLLTNLIFEPMDLEAASPATVSRIGMVYMEPSLLGWAPLFDSWMNVLPKIFNESHKQVILQMFNRFCPILLWFIKKGGLKVRSKEKFKNILVQSMIFFS